MTQIQAAGNITIDKVQIADVSAIPELAALLKRVELLELRAEATEVSGPPEGARHLQLPPGLEIDAAALGIVKAFDLHGSRIHVAFDVRNPSLTQAASVTAATLVVNGTTLLTKQFYVNDGRVRTPDSRSLPVRIPGDGVDRMSIEFENAGAAVVYADGIEAELRLDSDRGTAREKFGLEGPQPELVHVLGEMQKLVEAQRGAAVLDVPVAKVSAVDRP